MLATPSRLGLAFALTLAVPAACGGAWLWLTQGGVVSRAQAREREAAAQALLAAEQALQRELSDAATRLDLALQLDEARRVVAPFRGAPSAPAPVLGLAERAGLARLAAGRHEDARAYLQRAAGDGFLSPDGWLALARVLGRDDAAAARATLRHAAQVVGDAWCGPLPFALLATLQEVGYAEPERRDALFAAALLQVRRVTPGGVDAVVTQLAASFAAPADALPLAALQAAAAFVARSEAAPTAPAPGPEGSVLWPQARELRVVPAVAVAHARAAAQRELAAAGLSAASDGIAQRSLPALGETWLAAPRDLPASALLARTAQVCLGLAVFTFVCGNFLLWRLARREIALARLRRDFVDVVSHELRTPLTALSLKAEMLARGDVPPARVAHYLHALHGDVRRLNDQVQHILDFARLEKGGRLQAAAVSPRALLAQGLRSGLPALRLVQQRVHVDVPRALPSVVADVEVLGRALRNLLENAAKYAPAGSTVELRAYARGREVVVEVADRGPGVPAHEARAVFQPFVRGSSADNATPGSGLGLALVEAAARAHRGRVSVRPRDGGGAVFSLVLPACAQEAAS